MTSRNGSKFQAPAGFPIADCSPTANGRTGLPRLWSAKVEPVY